MICRNSFVKVTETQQSHTPGVDQLLISSFVREITPILFLHIGGKDCMYVATLKRWRITDPCRQQHRCRNQDMRQQAVSQHALSVAAAASPASTILCSIGPQQICDQLARSATLAAMSLRDSCADVIDM